MSSAADSYFRMGDMAVSSPSILSFHAKPGTLGAVKLKVEPWTHGMLPLRFAAGIDDEQKKMLLDACSEWSQVARVKCFEGSYMGRFLEVTREDAGCWAVWGMGISFGILRRKMNLGPGCWIRETLLHELGHAFGLIHEHQRPDRDEFVTIYPENVEPGFLGMALEVNFDKQAATSYSPYDFYSIMHYSRKAFSKNGLDTIVPKSPYEALIDQIGHATEISPGDAAALEALYGKPLE